jgi:PAS domain S-box-containing protein
MSRTWFDISSKFDAVDALSFRNSLILAAGIFISYIVIWLLLLDDPVSYTVFSWLGYILLNILSTQCLFYAAISSWRLHRKDYIAWMILAVAQLFWAIGDIINGYYELALHETPFPSLADIPYVLRYILFLVGIMLVLPSMQISFRERLKIIMDMAIVAIASLLFFWSLIISPTIELNIESDPLILALSVAYPALDLMLLFALIDLLLRRLTAPMQRTIIILAASTIFLIATDSIYNIQVLHGTYENGGFLDIGFPIAYILIGLAGLSQADSLKNGTLDQYLKPWSRFGHPTWPLYLPYLCAAGAFLLLIWSHYYPLALSFSTLAWSVGAIIGLVIMRQILALNENASLYNEAQEEIAERMLAEKEIMRLNVELEQRVMERTSELEAANKDLQSEIIERQEAEDALKDSEARLADIINFLPDATFVINKEGVVIAWNRAIEMLTGARAKDMLGKRRYEYSMPFYGEKRPMLIDLVLNADIDLSEKYENIKWQDDGSLVGEAYIPNLKEGALYLVGSAAVLYDSDGRIYGAIESMRDNTEHKLYEENLKSAKERAEDATKAKSEFLANMSHEIRTPLNAVIGMTGLLMETDLKPEQRDYLETIQSSGNALLALINDILDFSKIDGRKMILENQAFDLQSCIELSVDLVAAKAAQKRLDLAYLVDEKVPRMLFGDATRLRQILVNLLGNAVKFTEKGQIVLSVSSSRLEDGRFELQFAVKDTGIGISPENMGKLFQSFTQVDSSTTRVFGGTGLGLAISKRLVELMGGRIWSESEPGLGSTFYFTAKLAAIENNGADAPLDLRLLGKRAAIIEGNDAVRNMLVQFARSWGMQATGFAGLDMANGLEKERYDFVLLDAAILDERGLTPVREMNKSSDSRTAIIVMSPIGHKARQDPDIFGHLTKPVKPHQLRNLMIMHLAQQDPLQTAVGTRPCEMAQVAERENLRILLAEDNPINQKVAIQMLKRLGYKADVAFNGQEVLQALARQPYDLVLMDIQMPKMDGLEATRRIREMKMPADQTCIMAMTAYALEGDREECLKAGMNDFISKPIKMDELQKALQRCAQSLAISRNKGSA